MTRGGSEVALTATEFKMLSILIRNRTRGVPKRQLVDQLWGYEAANHVLEVHMSALHRKIEAHGPRMIQTIRDTDHVLRP